MEELELEKYKIPLYINECRYIHDYSFIEHYKRYHTNQKYRTINDSHFGIFIKIYKK